MLNAFNVSTPPPPRDCEPVPAINCLTVDLVRERLSHPPPPTDAAVRYGNFRGTDRLRAAARPPSARPPHTANNVLPAMAALHWSHVPTCGRTAVFPSGAFSIKWSMAQVKNRWEGEGMSSGGGLKNVAGLG